MKIIPAHFEYLKSAIAPFDTEESRRAYIALGLSDKRYRWDCYWKAKIDRWVCDVLYKYCNDDHIDTALRNIVRPL